MAKVNPAAWSTGDGSVAERTNVRACPRTPSAGPDTTTAGGRFRTTTTAVPTATPSDPSDTVRVTVYVPLSWYVWVATAPVAVVPSPKSHR